MSDPAEVFATLTQARALGDAIAAGAAYQQKCAAMPGLGVAVRLAPPAEAGGRPRLVAVADIPERAPITAFPPDLVVYAHAGDRFAHDCRPEAERLPAESWQRAVDHYAIPLAGFPPLVALVGDPSAPAAAVRPPAAAAFVADVVDANPYMDCFSTADAEGHLAWTAENIPALARAAAAHLDRIAAASNARVGCAVGSPTVLLATRPIAAGEAIVAGRRPHYWLGCDDALTEAILAELLATAARAGAPKGPAEARELRIQLGLCA